MEPHRRPAGRRVLLPAEIELCEAVGISEEEYWHFVDITEAYNGERNEAYALIPDIRNEPATTTAILINLAIGLVLTGVSLLLAPKPKSPQQQEKDDRLGTLELGGKAGVDRFAQTQGFQSAQELAKLGQTIPLVFAKKGVRVNGLLLWSQMITLARGQQLRALFAFSDGGTEGLPDYEGLAVGDTLLATYTKNKVAAYWKAFGGRPREPLDRFPTSAPGNGGLQWLPEGVTQTDAFGTYWESTNQIEPFFSGAQFTSVQAAFGAYAPMFNNTFYRPTHELVLIPDDADDNFKDDLQRRRDLYEGQYVYGSTYIGRFSQGSFFTFVSNPITGPFLGHVGQVTPGTGGAPFDTVTYRITTHAEPQEYPALYGPNPLDFVNSATNAARTAADTSIALGELYLLGDETLGICTKIISESGNPYDPWLPTTYVGGTAQIGNDKSFVFTVTEKGFVDTIPGAGVSVGFAEQQAIANPKAPWESYALQRAAIATVTNTRACKSTELIIKSNVWRRVSGFPDMSAYPSAALVNEYEQNNGSIQLGQLNKYISRLSFFKLEVRPVGTNVWINVTTNYFCVEGNRPIDQYHYIRVYDTYDYLRENEFRLRPVSGIGALRKGGQVWRLRSGYEGKYAINNYVITVNGELVSLPSLSDGFAGDTAYGRRGFISWTNPEFIRKQDSDSRETLDNADITPKQAGTFSTTITTTGSTYGSWYQEVPERFNTNVGYRNFCVKRISFTSLTDNYYEYRWDDVKVASGTLPTQSTEPPAARINEQIEYRWAGSRIILNQGGYLFDFRTIQRWRRDPITTTTTTDAVRLDYQVNDAVPVSVSEGATGLKFYIEQWGIDGVVTGYKWFIDKDNRGTGYQVGDTLKVIWNNPDGTIYEIYGVTVTGTTVVTETDRPYENFAPFDAILDVVSYEGQTASNQDGPEHEVVAINEKLPQSKYGYGTYAVGPQYDKMTLGGLIINASTEWSNFSSFSAFMKRGIVLEQLATGNKTEASNLLPDIVFGMMTNVDWGAGKILGEHQLDKDSMAIASRFCSANDFTWDGVVSERINFREWVFQNAQYCLLDATVIGGRFALIPAVPYNSDYTIGNFLKPSIKALFTDGNMKDMEVQWLSPQERQPFIAEMLWRQDTVNGFPTTQQFTMRLANSQGGSETDPVETFDLTSFCTSELHAARYAYYALRVRQLVDHGIKFKTTPQAAMGLIPGDYFKVSSQSSHTSRFNNGSINDEGYITSVEDLSDGTHSIYYWEPGTVGVREGTLIVFDGRTTDPTFYNKVFTVVMTSEQNRVYKLESLSYAEDGLVEVAGSYMPLTSSGSLKILDWNPDDFEGAGINLG